MSKNIFEKLESSWIFWILFLATFIASASMILAGKESGVTALVFGFIYFPLGLFMLFKINSSSTLVIWVELIAWYVGVFTIIRFIVKSKGFNTKLILLLLLILVMTFVGCQTGGMY